MKRAEKVTTERVKKEKFVRETFPTLTPRNDNQKILLDLLRQNTLVVAAGSAGTGKTIIACHHAAKKLHHNDVKKVVLIRAYQPLAGRSIGFLPGSLDEKLMPYYQQMIDYFEDYLGKATVEIYLKQKVIEIYSWTLMGACHHHRRRSAVIVRSRSASACHSHWRQQSDDFLW
jgi:phosphate starvation-inducible protein PhoH